MAKYHKMGRGIGSCVISAYYAVTLHIPLDRTHRSPPYEPHCEHRIVTAKKCRHLFYFAGYWPVECLELSNICLDLSQRTTTSMLLSG